MTFFQGFQTVAEGEQHIYRLGEVLISQNICIGLVVCEFADSTQTSTQITVDHVRVVRPIAFCEAQDELYVDSEKIEQLLHQASLLG